MSHHANDEKPTQQWVEMASVQDSSIAAIDGYQPGSDAEKKLLRKLDYRIVVSAVHWALTNTLLT